MNTSRVQLGEFSYSVEEAFVWLFSENLLHYLFIFVLLFYSHSALFSMCFLLALDCAVISCFCTFGSLIMIRVFRKFSLGCNRFLFFLFQYTGPDKCKNGIPVGENDRYFATCDDEKMRRNAIPTIFNLEKDPSELYPLDPTDYEYLLSDLNQAVQQHQATLVMAPYNLGRMNPQLRPCCTGPGSYNCSCNYPLAAKFGFLPPGK